MNILCVHTCRLYRLGPEAWTVFFQIYPQHDRTLLDWKVSMDKMQAKELVGFMLDEERSERLQLALHNLRLIHIVFEASVSNVDKRDQLRIMKTGRC